MVVIFSLGTYKTDICVPKQLSVYTQECAIYKISWGGWAGGICPSWKIYRRDSVHLVKMSGRDYIHVRKKHGRDYVHLYKNEQKGLCPGGILSYTRSTVIQLTSIWYRIWRYMQLTIKMCTWTYMYMDIKGQGHSLTLVQGHSDSTLSNFFSLETAGPIEAKFHVEPPWDGGTWPIWLPCPYWSAMSIYVKNLKNLLLWNQKTDGMQHRVLKYYQICSNDDPGMTVTYFMARSNLVPYAFVWEKGKTMDFSETIVVFDVKVGRCRQLNVYMKLMSIKGQGHSLTLIQISQIQYF